MQGMSIDYGQGAHLGASGVRSFDSSNAALLSAFQSQHLGLENSFSNGSSTVSSYTSSAHSPAQFDSSYVPSGVDACHNSQPDESASAVTAAAKVAAVAAVAANQYLSASFNAVSSVAAAAAAAAAATNHHYHRYPNYHFELNSSHGGSTNGKQSTTAQLECKRGAVNSSNYSHLSYSGI
jgi:hypothetical protein